MKGRLLGRFRLGSGSFRSAGVIVGAALIGYLGAGLGLDQHTDAFVAQTPYVLPTPTVARAVTFTPTAFIPASVVESPTPAEITVVSTVVPSPTLAPSETPSVTPSPTLASEFYVVQSGDTIVGISKKFGVSQDAIIQANGLADANQLSLGQKLVIPR